MNKEHEAQWAQDEAKGLVSHKLLLPCDTLVEYAILRKKSARQIDERCDTGHTMAGMKRKGYPAPVAHFQRILRFLGYVIVRPDKAYLQELAEQLGYTIQKK